MKRRYVAPTHDNLLLFYAKFARTAGKKTQDVGSEDQSYRGSMQDLNRLVQPAEAAADRQLSFMYICLVEVTFL